MEDVETELNRLITREYCSNLSHYPRLYLLLAKDTLFVYFPRHMSHMYVCRIITVKLQHFISPNTMLRTLHLSITNN